MHRLIFLLFRIINAKRHASRVLPIQEVLAQAHKHGSQFSHNLGLAAIYTLKL